MALRTSIKRLFWVMPLVCELSCVNAPVELVLDKKLEMTEAKVNEISDDILVEIKNIDVEEFGPTVRAPGQVDPEDCKAAFNNWITEEFKKDLVPKRVVTVLEYGVGSRASYMDQCNAIDMEKEFKRSKEEAAGKKTKKDSIFFNFQKLRDAFSKAGPCASNYIAPGKRKLAVHGMKMRITTNTLNVNSSVYNVYYSTVPVTEAELEEDGAEQKLKDNGTLKLYATSQPAPPKFTGIMPFDIIEDEEALAAAKAKIETFDTELIAIPSQIDREFETKVINGQTYFVIPRGQLLGQVGVDISLKAEIGDAICAWQKYKRESKEEK